MIHILQSPSLKSKSQDLELRINGSDKINQNVTLELPPFIRNAIDSNYLTLR